MASQITIQQSFSGFIVSDPQLGFTAGGDARFYARVGQEHFKRADDGSFFKLDTTYHNLVMFRRSAERAYEQFGKGDNIVAEGYLRTFKSENAGGSHVESEEFVAKKIGHDTARPTYEVKRVERDVSARSKPPQPEPAAREAPGHGHSHHVSRKRPPGPGL